MTSCYTLNLQSDYSLTIVFYIKDLEELERWGENWGMHFNAKKCNIIPLACQSSPLLFDYVLGGHTLELVTDVKYLGVTYPTT